MHVHGQEWNWFGDPSEWNLAEDSTAHLAQLMPGDAWIYTCPTGDPPTEIQWKWTTAFSGSNGNHSAIHLFSLPPGAYPGDSSLQGGPPENSWRFHIGESGSNDGLDITSPTGEQTTVMSGELSGPFDLRLQVFSSEGEDSIQIWSSPQPGLHPLAPSVNLPNDTTFDLQCIGISATVTSSNLTGVSFRIEEWKDWTPDTIPPEFLDAYLLNTSTVRWMADELIHGQSGTWWVDVPLDEMATPGVPISVGSPLAWDLWGNASLEGATSRWVVWTDPLQHAPRHIVFTEILVDPTPSVHLPEVEWVEVINNSHWALQLGDLIWWDQGSGESSIVPVSPWNGILNPGERAILSAEEDALPLFEGFHHAALPNGGALSDHEDAIGLILPDGRWGDVVNWGEGNWDPDGRHGRSWQKQFLDGCSSAVNWRASVSPLGATPGTAGWNEAPGSGPFADSVFRVVQTLARSETLTELEFNQPLDRQGLDFLPTGWGGNILDENQLKLELKRPHVSIVEMDRWPGLKPCFASSNPTGLHWQWPETAHRFVEPGDIVIREIMANPGEAGPGPAAEWIELQNLTDENLNATGIKIQGQSMESQIIIPPRGRWVYSFPDPHSLPNSTGVIQLENASGDPLDSVQYHDCDYRRRSHVQAGMSLVRTCESNQDWTTSASEWGASPGFPDPAEHCPKSDSPRMPEWQLCGQKADGSQIALLLDANVEFVQTQNADGDWIQAEPLNLVGVKSGRVWTFGRNAIDENLTWIQVGILEDEIRVLSAPNHCQMQSTGSPDWLLSEVLFHSDIEPFVELQAHIESPALSASTASIAFTTAPELNTTANWHPLTKEIHWWLPHDQPWAWAECPNRVASTRVLPLAQMPSFWGNPTLSLIETMDNWAMARVDSVQTGNHRHAPWVSDPHHVSIERCDEGAHWTSCRNAKGHSAGMFNSIWGLCQGASASDMHLSSTVWEPGGPPLIITVCPESLACAPEITLYEAWSMSPQVVLHSPEATGDSTCVRFIWEGETHTGSGVPAPGAYLWRAIGCPLQTTNLWSPFVVISP